jgi:hypothetical protein
MNLEELYENGNRVMEERGWLLPEGSPLLDQIKQYRWGQTGFGILTRSSSERYAACSRAVEGTGVSWP